MRAIHVNWTKPFFHRDRLRGHGFNTTRELKSETYDQPDYQILYTMLSAVYWKELNGPIKLYTDSVGLAFYQQFRIPELYNEIDINFLNIAFIFLSYKYLNSFTKRIDRLDL